MALGGRVGRAGGVTSTVNVGRAGRSSSVRGVEDGCTDGRGGMVAPAGGVGRGPWSSRCASPVLGGGVGRVAVPVRGVVGADGGVGFAASVVGCGAPVAAGGLAGRGSRRSEDPGGRDPDSGRVVRWFSLGADGRASAMRVLSVGMGDANADPTWAPTKTAAPSAVATTTRLADARRPRIIRLLHHRALLGHAPCGSIVSHVWATKVRGLP